MNAVNSNVNKIRLKVILIDFKKKFKYIYINYEIGSVNKQITFRSKSKD